MAVTGPLSGSRLAPWALALAVEACAPAMAAEPLRVVDGDTVTWSIRLAGFDTPETWLARADCPLEIERGYAAKARLEMLIATARRVRFRPRLRGDGTVRTGRWGRLIGTLEIDGVDAGELLVRDGLAVRYDYRRETIDWCATPPAKRRK